MTHTPRGRRARSRPAHPIRLSLGLTLAACAAQALYSASLAMAQQIITEGDETDTLVIGEQKKLPTFHFDRPTGYLDLLGTYTSDSAKPKGSPSLVSRETFIQENLNLATSGYIVHPNLVNLHLSGTFGLVQDWTESSGNANTNQNNESNNYLSAWDVTADILRNQAVNGTLYTQRSDNFVDQSFGPTLYDTTTTYGANVNLQNKTVPTQFRVYHTDETQSTGFGGPENFSIAQDVFQWHSEARPTSNQYLSWDYTFNHSDQTAGAGGGVNTSSDSQAAALGHSLSFGGAAHPSTLDSTLRYSEETGYLANQDLNWDELLRLRHTQNFETDYEYRLDDSSFDNGLDQTLQRGTAGFRHQLYKSLTTVGNVGIQDLTLSDGSDSRDYFGDLNFDYRKEVPKGTLFSDLGFSYDQQSNSARTQEVQVVDQPFSFVDFQPYTVTRTGIVPTSVIIRDATGQVFTEGVDYRVHARPDGIELDRIPGGRIPENDPLLLTYDLGPTPAYDVTTEGFHTGLRYTFTETFLKGLSPYIRYGRTDQTVSGGGGTIIPNDVNDYIEGVDYIRFGLRVRYEHENYYSTILPYEANRFELEWQKRLTLDTTLAVNGTYDMIDYTSPALQTDTASLSASITHNFTRNLLATLSGSWVNVNDSAGNSSNGFQEALEIRWQERLMEIYGRFRNSNLDSNVDTRDFQFFQVGLRRSF